MHLGWAGCAILENEGEAISLHKFRRLCAVGPLLTMLGKIKEWRHTAATWQLQVRLSQLVEERVRTGLQWADTSAGRVLQQAGHESDRLWRGPCSEHLKERNHKGVNKTGGQRTTMGVVGEREREFC